MAVAPSDTASGKSSLWGRPRDWIIGGPVLVLAGLALYGMRSRGFIPSDLTVQLGTTATLAAAVAGGIWGFRMQPLKAASELPFLARGPIRRALGFALLAAVLAYPLLTGVLANWYTRIAGTSTEKVFRVESWHRGRKLCDGPSFAEAGSHGICLAQSWRRLLPPGTNVTARGIASPLGMAVHAVDMPDGTRVEL